MNKKAREAVWAVIVFSVTLSVLFLMTFVFATFDATIPSGQGNITITVLDDTNPTINITINNTGPAGFNLTEVWILLDSRVNASVGGITNGTSASGHNVTYPGLGVLFSFNRSVGSYGPNTALNWSNVSVQAQPGGYNESYFWFNITTYAPGKGLNISLFAFNNSGGGGNYSLTYNITLNINDTFNISIARPLDGDNISNGVYTIVDFGDNETAVNVSILLYNSTGFVLASNRTNQNTPYYVNFTDLNTTTLADGVYYLNATINNSDNLNDDDQNWTSITKFTLDRVAPTYSMTRNTASTQSKIVIDLAITDATTGVNGTCSVDSGTATITRTTDTAQQMTLESLNCGTSYDFIFRCADRAGNLGVASSITASTDACSGGGGSSGGGGGGSSGTTFRHDSVELAELGSVNRGLRKDDAVAFKVSGESHKLEVTSVSSNSASVAVSSSHTQTATLNVGEVRKFDVSGDGYYDLSVTLNSVTATRADVTLSSIREVAELEEEPSDSGDTARTPSAGEVPGQVTGSLVWLWIILAVVVVVVIAYFVMKGSRNKRR